jgi:hypothetical protein
MKYFTAEEQALDDKYQEGFKSGPISKEGCPPCPRCSGKMIPKDYWLITAAICEDCNWTVVEGTGCLL